MGIGQISKLVVLLTIVGLIGYDFFAIYKGGTESSVSWTIFEWSYRYPAFTFGMGFVMGHLFWQMKGLKRLNKE